ncbi:hypothetical protein CALVIDRAFT_595942 [Calocera viscosa TUFC12733]|uniref:DUF1772-domain-containing protein n=1 Tax=Calocera viscosa (strain TUFC12733) TaxID=1330018 RepID=A0A167Q1F8_CALVF|nr:hypothetical protein CALVIDRAFT_595942 [Calocera viscosa TUFC12733]
MSANDTVNKVLTVLAVSGSAYFAGFTASTSILMIPVLPLAPAPLAAKQWAKMYAIGVQLAPGMGLLPGLLFAYLAWANDAGSLAPRGIAFALAGLFAGSNVPWTLSTMVSTNKALQAIADEPATTTAEIEKDSVKKEKREEEVKKLVGAWQTLNALRGFWPVFGTLIGGAVAVGLV